MKKRAMKKWIPDGMYCHGHLSFMKEENGIPILHYKHWCRNMVFDHIHRNSELIGGGTRDRIIYRCRYLGVTTEEDILLDDDCKICSVRDF